MNFVCIVFELGDKMLTLSSMENLIVQCNLKGCRVNNHFDTWTPTRQPCIYPLPIYIPNLNRTLD